MQTAFRSIANRIISPDGAQSLPLGPFDLEQLEDFPYLDWTNMQQRYAVLEKWYSGEALNQKIENDQTGEVVDKYPIRINPIQNTCEKHATVLLGDNLESIRNGNLPIRFSIKKKLKPGEKRDPSENDKNIAIINDALVATMQDAGAGAMFVSNAILSQYHGGCVFGVGWRPGSKTSKVQVFTPLPTEFLGIPSGTNPWRLREAWFVREISESEAKLYGAAKRKDSKYFYIEKWTDDEYSLRINDKVIVVDVDGEKVRMSGKNLFGVIPFVYIPHIRVRGYYGESIINETIKGLIKEMNLRFADTGDAISDDSHTELAIRNVRDSITPVTLPSGKKVTDLGSSAGLGAGEKEPDLFSIPTESASEPMLKFGEKLENLYRKEARHPAVADGEDEGSQRSSLTLTTRMWPLIAHVNLERINWTTGLIKLAYIILVICKIKKVYGITQEHIDNYEVNIIWALSLPRDRDSLINELAIRKKNHLGSLRHLLSLLDDVDDIDEELALIEAGIEKEAARNQEKFDANGEDTSENGDDLLDEKEPKATNIPRQQEK